jgi:hypothetical protein
MLELLLFQEISTPDVLYEEVVEVDSRVVPALPGRCLLKEGLEWRHVIGTTGEELLVCQELNEDTLEKDLTILKEKGINSVAVVLAHSYMWVSMAPYFWFTETKKCWRYNVRDVYTIFIALISLFLKFASYIGRICGHAFWRLQ